MIWFSSPEQWEMVEKEIATGARGLQKLLHTVGNRLCSVGSPPLVSPGDQIAEIKYSKLPSSPSHGSGGMRTSSPWAEDNTVAEQ
ncbi:hypothetical protein R1flu_015105 [Riccia fluitans]|uniref:Uncharacterized protein n=1 Tax=Riccia fluitans TaxID=41844 RepID=A0ABD1YJ34_9MARC